MIKKINEWLGVVTFVLVLTLVVMVLVGGNNQSVGLGASGTRFPNGLSADSTSPVAGQVRGTTLTITGASTLGGTLTVTSTNAATSTVKAGCFEMAATSTATKVRFIIGTTNTGASSTASTAAIQGFVTWGYGSCPN